MGTRAVTTSGHFSVGDDSRDLPAGWSWVCVDEAIDLIRQGPRFDARSVKFSGRVPVLDQTERGIFGFHDGDAGVQCDARNVVATFANHTCNLRLMTVPFSTIQNVFAFRGKANFTETSFLYFWLQGRIASDEYKGFFPTLRQMTLPLPPLEEQRRIAIALGALDDLIEVDRSLLRTLLDVARAQFRMECSTSHETVELGLLYQVGLSGVWGEDSASDKASSRVSVLRGRDVQDLLEANRVSAPVRFVSARQEEARTPRVGEIWTAGSGSLGPSLPVTRSLRDLFGGEPVLYSNFVKRLVPLDDNSWFGVAWLSMMEAWDRGLFENFRTGTAMPNLDANALLRGVAVPRLSGAARQRINDLVESFFRPELRQEIAQLESARDELLPLLMSGRVRVKDVAA